MSNVRQYLPLVARPNADVAPKLNAFLDGADEIVAQLEAYAEYAQDQFFFTTADAEYVFKLAARAGFYLPRNAGLNIEGLKPLAPLMINQPKTTLALVAQLIEIYFSQILARPNIVCAQAEPYYLKENDDLIVKTRDAEHRLTVDTTVFSNIRRVSAAELATYINSVQNYYIATVFYDRSISKNKIKLIAGGAGANEIIQVIGGTLQNVLLFPNVVPTTNTVQTRWAVSKETDYTDVVTFQYIDGPLPSVYQTKVGDIVTIRNQFDVGSSGMANLELVDLLGDTVVDLLGNPVLVSVNLIQGNYSTLNGSYEIIEMGYDYFKIRNRFLRLPIANYGEVIQFSSRDIIFTENQAHRVYEQETFSYLTEMTQDEITVTVPAVPPIVKRFLEGAWHFYGVRHSVTDFTRNSIKIDTLSEAQKPNVGNTFILQSSGQSPNFKGQNFKVLNISSTGGLITIDSSDEYAILPYTTPTLTNNTDSFFCDFESNIVEMSFGYRHGLTEGSVFSISGSTSNLISGLSVNGIYLVEKVISPTKIAFKIDQKNISSPSAATATLSALGDKQYRLQYSSNVNLGLSGLDVVGKKFRLYTDGTATILNAYVWQKLKSRVQTVRSVDTNAIVFESLDDLSVLVGDIIATTIQTQTAQTTWGGSGTRYYFDKSNEINISLLLNNLELVITDFLKPTSSLYLGSYLFDPQGTYYKFLPSATGTVSQSRTLKGESGVIISVGSTDGFSDTGGYLVLDYGTANAEGPVRYLAISENQIVIDPSYVFKNTHEISSTVRDVKQTTAVAPNTNGKTYQPFITGVAQARESFFELLKLAISAGVFVSEDVLYPELRFSDESIKPYE